MPSYRLAKVNEAAEIDEICAGSFASYPLYRIMLDDFRDEENYSRFVYELHLMIIRVTLKYHHLFVGVEGDKIVSTAML